ncbi:hypothetical protein A2U01_0105944, partial [Trifolium medium]|nr:hypothetical protein [Trifolium medium]
QLFYPHFDRQSDTGDQGFVFHLVIARPEFEPQGLFDQYHVRTFEHDAGATPSEVGVAVDRQDPCLR